MAEVECSFSYWFIKGLVKYEVGKSTYYFTRK